MAANSWSVDGTAASLLGKQPAPQPGVGETYKFKLNPSNAQGVASVRDRYHELRSRWRHSSTLSIDVTIDDVVFYTDVATGESALGAFEPVDDPLGKGFYGLIVDGSDEVVSTDDGAGQEIAVTISLDVAFVADLSEYADKQAVRDRHEKIPFH